MLQIFRDKYTHFFILNTTKRRYSRDRIKLSANDQKKRTLDQYRLRLLSLHDTRRGIPESKNRASVLRTPCLSYFILTVVSIGEKRIFLHRLIDTGTYRSNDFFVVYIRQHSLNHFCNFNHQVFFSSTGSDSRCS